VPASKADAIAAALNRLLMHQRIGTFSARLPLGIGGLPAGDAAALRATYLDEDEKMSLTIDDGREGGSSQEKSSAGPAAQPLTA
jgi:hypothetical protein